uniref:Uncharacterized protein n=1 Tax=Rhizophora mucronata TaxID=61149 RepID=A0A2P2IJ14_RHIMU
MIAKTTFKMERQRTPPLFEAQ